MKQILTVSLFLLLSLFVAGQQSLFHSPSANQQLIEEAVAKGLFLLRQDYQIKDTATGKYYGRGGDVFGSVYALGIRLKGGYCLSDRGIRPWEYDENFNDYRKGYLPVMYRTYWRETADTVMAKYPKWNEKQVKELVAGRFSYVTDSLFRGEGFEIDLISGKKAGWLVWVVSGKTIAEAGPQTPVSYTIYRKELELREGIGEYAIDAPAVNLNIWGGIYVVPVQTAVGQITFRLAGVVDKQEEHWTVFTPFGKIPVPVTQVSGDAGVLTPVEREGETVVPQAESEKESVEEVKGKNKRTKK